MKLPAIAAALLILTACASAPTESTPAVAAASGQAAAKPAPGKPETKVVTTTSPNRVCENSEALGSRLKRPRCHDVPEGGYHATAWHPQLRPGKQSMPVDFAVGGSVAKLALTLPIAVMAMPSMSHMHKSDY